MVDPQVVDSTRQEVRAGFIEPVRGVGTKWLSYDLRYGLGLALLVTGFIATVVLQMPADLNDRVLRGVALVPPFLGVVLSAIVFPGRAERRIAFAALAMTAVVPFILPLTISNTQKSVSILFFALSAGLMAWAWMALRERRAGLHALALVASLFTLVVGSVFTQAISPYGPLNPGYPELFGFGSLADDPSYVELLRESATIWVIQLLVAAIGVIGVAWIARAISTKLNHYTPAQKTQLKVDAELRAKAAQEQAAQQARVDEIKKWEAAYAQAHDGQLPPAGFAPPILVTASTGAAAGRTNTLAILSLIFGLLGGWLGIVLGFIALAQIRKTGESGRGMAITGIVFAFVWGIGIVIVALSIGIL